ncbi:MAG TPA: 1,4-alpha-glucan branching enzyme, partial [Bacteroidia bacterium]|nr:1,4-alpha-glucan branching enzyme [Bacteroidia bacterium]
AHGLARFDGTALYEHADPRQGEHADWGTLIFNYGRNEVRNFLIGNAMFWLQEYHIDGLRVDAVASMLYLDYSREHGQWVPNQYGGRENIEAIDFLRQLNQVCYEENPGIMIIAEESTAFPGVSRPVDTGGLGFGFKWNMGWMNDSLDYMSHEPVHRKYHHGKATFSMIYAYHENYVLVLSHDEVVHGKGSLIQKMPGDRWQQMANARLFLAWMFAHPGKKLLFQGLDFGQAEEWDYAQSLPWHLLDYGEHQGIHRLVRDLNHLYVSEPALHQLDHEPAGFEWIDHNDAKHSLYSFIRRGSDGGIVVVLVNATPVPRPGYRLGVPGGGFYEEILNTDSALYGGSNIGSAGGIPSREQESHGRSHSIQVDVPPLATVFFRLRKV